MNSLESDIKITQRKTITRSVKGKQQAKAGVENSNLKKVDRVMLSEPSKTSISKNSTKTPVSDIRHELVDKYRDVLQKGSYEVKADEIAEKIVQKIKENKSHLAL